MLAMVTDNSGVNVEGYLLMHLALHALEDLLESLPAVERFITQTHVTKLVDSLTTYRHTDDIATIVLETLLLLSKRCPSVRRVIVALYKPTSRASSPISSAGRAKESTRVGNSTTSEIKTARIPLGIRRSRFWRSCP